MKNKLFWSFSQRADPGLICIPSDGKNNVTAWHTTTQAQSSKWKQYGSPAGYVKEAIRNLKQMATKT